MPIPPRTQDIVESARSSQKNEAQQAASALLSWRCGLCWDARTDEPLADSLTPETRRFVDRRLEAAIAELRRLDPGRREVRLAIDGLKELRDEFGP